MQISRGLRRSLPPARMKAYASFRTIKDASRISLRGLTLIKSELEIQRNDLLSGTTLMANSLAKRVSSPRQSLLNRLEAILACPQCHCSVEISSNNDGDSAGILCKNCGAVGQRKPDQLCLGGFTTSELRQDFLNHLKETAKRKLATYYPLAISILAPVHMRNLVPRFIQSFDTTTELVADLGSGTNSYRDQVVCVDGGNYQSVHVTADLARLPFQDESLSGIVSIAVLEHVPNPVEHVREFLRVLKPGGRVLCYIPFIQGYHASPHDYQRFTSQGMRKLFSNFDDIRVSVGAGPTSGFLWILQEWLALVFSFGSLRLYRWLMPLTWILSPLKYLDLLLVHHPAADVIASAFFVEAVKPRQS